MIDNYRKMLTIDRLAGKFKLRKYDLAQHCYYTGILFMHFANLENIEYSKETIEIVFAHDLMEVATTDLPWNCKNLNETTKECWATIENEAAKAFPDFQRFSDDNIKNSLSKEQFTLFKVMDYLELFLFIHEEILLGNTTWEMIDIYERCIDLNKGKYKSVDDFMMYKFNIGKKKYQ